MGQFSSEGACWSLAAAKLIDVVESDAAKAAIEELRAFIDSDDGRIAVHALLAQTGRHIVFGKTHEIHPGHLPTVYALRGGIAGGLVRTTTPTEGHFAPTFYHQVVSASAEEAVAAAILLGNKKPEEIMSWLRGELNTIAAEVLLAFR